MSVAPNPSDARILSLLVHNRNLLQKEGHDAKYRDEESRRFLAEIRTSYNRWHQDNMSLVGPHRDTSEEDQGVVNSRVELFTEYKDFLDQQHYAEKFDSRSNLHSTALEEFMYYLFKDLVGEYGEHALIGKSHAFKDIFFVPPSYADMLRRPFGRIEIKDHDFVIGASIEASFRSSAPPERDRDAGEEVTIIAESPSDYYDVTVTHDAETHRFDIPESQ